MKSYCIGKQVRCNQNSSLTCDLQKMIFWKCVGETYSMGQYSYSRVWQREMFNRLQNIFMQVLPAMDQKAIFLVKDSQKPSQE